MFVGKKNKTNKTERLKMKRSNSVIWVRVIMESLQVKLKVNN